VFGVAAWLWALRGGFVDGEEQVAGSLEGEGRGIVRYRDDDEGLFGRDGGCGCAEDAELVAAQISGLG